MALQILDYLAAVATSFGARESSAEPEMIRCGVSLETVTCQTACLI